MCNGVNSLYILIVHSYKLQVVLLTDQDPGCSCLCCILERDILTRFRFICSKAVTCDCCIPSRSAAHGDNL